MKVLELESFAGNHISSVCEKVAALSNSENSPVHFVFNGVHVTAQPGESAEALERRWDADREVAYQAWMASPERKERETKAAEELRLKMAAHMTEPANTEVELRQAKVPWPYTKEQLQEYIESLVNRTHDYGTCVYAMSMAAEAAFNYVSHCLGVTGFQASCADLDFVRRTRSMKGPFILIKAEDMVFPQYDVREKLEEAIEGWEPWVKEQAEKELAAAHEHVHADVRHHWEMLAGKVGAK